MILDFARNFDADLRARAFARAGAFPYEKKSPNQKTVLALTVPLIAG